MCGMNAEKTLQSKDLDIKEDLSSLTSLMSLILISSITQIKKMSKKLNPFLRLWRECLEIEAGEAQCLEAAAKMNKISCLICKSKQITWIYLTVANQTSLCAVHQNKIFMENHKPLLQPLALIWIKQ